jgi:membrane protein DedA with SNARE-associated domain
MAPSTASRNDQEGDHLLEAAAEAVARRAESPVDRLLLRASGWLAEHTVARFFIAGSALTLALTPGVVLLIVPDLTDGLAGFSYGGVFLTNLASTATFYFPVPGLTAAAQTLIATQGEKSNLPWLVGIAGGAGMAVGEITAYYAGYLGAELARGRELSGPGRLRRAIERATRTVRYLMDHWGMATLFVLSAIPNPIFEVAGITAGSVRMSFRRFLLSVTAGKILRGLILAYYGASALDAVTNLFHAI